jgi:RNA recognition motif-containing protein
LLSSSFTGIIIYYFLIFCFMNIYVSNLSFHTTDEDLNSMFGKFGQVSSAKVIMDKVTGRSRGFGFVEMPSEDEGKLAMTGLNNKEIEGRAISVSVAREREERGSSSGGGRSGSYSPRGGSGGGGSKRW